MNVQHRVNNNILYKRYNIFYFNINSLMNKMEDVEDAIARCSQIIHFIALTEVKLYSNEIRDYDLPDYDVSFHNSPDGYGGVALYVHRSLRCSKTYARFNSNVNLLVVKINSLQLNIAVVYKQPAVDAETFYRIFEGFLSRCDENKEGTIVIGDMNIDLLKPNKPYRDLVADYEFKILNKIHSNHATRVAERSSTIIDHVLTNIETSFSVSLRNCGFSDHRQMIIGFD